jgi:DNA-binding beta-propeller fold protein YncE
VGVAVPPAADLGRTRERSVSMNRRDFVVGAAALALAPRALANARAPLALVTADEESRLVAVDLATGRVRAHISTLPSPRSIEAVGETAVVAHSELGAVSLVRNLEVVGVLRGLAEPRYTAAHPDGRHAYVTDAARGEVVALDVVRSRVVGRASVGARARHIAISPNGRRLWIALGSKADEVAIVDLSQRAEPRLVRTFRPPFRAHDVAWAPDGRHVWVSSGDRHELAVYDAHSGRVVARQGGDWPPQHVAFAGGLAYVTSGWSGTVRVHRVTGEELRRNPVPVGSYNVQHGGDRVLTPALGHGTLTVLDETGRTLYRAQVARSSHDVCVV